MKDILKLTRCLGQSHYTSILYGIYLNHDLKNILNKYEPHFASQIDWNRGYTFQNELLPLYKPAKDLKNDDIYSALFKANLLDGNTATFMLSFHTDKPEEELKIIIDKDPHQLYESVEENINLYLGIMEEPDPADSINLSEILKSIYEGKEEDHANDKDIPEMKAKLYDYEEEEFNDEEYNDEADDATVEEASDALISMLKEFTNHLKSGKLNPANQSNHCTKCGRSDLPLTTAIDAVNMVTDKLCTICLHDLRIDTKHNNSLKKLDKNIRSLKKLARKYEALIKDHPVPVDVPVGLENFAFTPLSSYKSTLALIADLKYKRAALMTTLSSSVRLHYELKKAVRTEDFEQAAFIKQQLRDMGEEE
jgi:hypothetical protein